MAASLWWPGDHAGRRLRLAAAALACLLTAAGCSAQGAKGPAVMPRPAGIVRGTLVLEYPNNGNGIFAVVANIPGPGRLQIISGHVVAATVAAGRSGGFRVRVPAGRYRFQLVAPARARCTADTPPAPETFTVRPGRVTQVQVFCVADRHDRHR